MKKILTLASLLFVLLFSSVYAYTSLELEAANNLANK
jgi:uncharacterized membrane protein